MVTPPSPACGARSEPVTVARSCPTNQSNHHLLHRSRRGKKRKKAPPKDPLARPQRSISSKPSTAAISAVLPVISNWIRTRRRWIMIRHVGRTAMRRGCSSRGCCSSSSSSSSSSSTPSRLLQQQQSSTVRRNTTTSRSAVGPKNIGGRALGTQAAAAAFPRGLLNGSSIRMIQGPRDFAGEEAAEGDVDDDGA
jgi:hypothetical protein